MTNLLASSETEEPPAAFAQYVAQGKTLAMQASLVWEICLDESGVAIPGKAWDLRKITKDGNPTSAKLRTFSTSVKAVDELTARGILPAIAPPGASLAISVHWQDLIKAYVLKQLLVSGASVTHVSSTCRALRLIATVTGNKCPWRLTADDVDMCLSVAKALQPSGQMTIVISSFIKTVLDAYHLVETAPLYPFIGAERLLRAEKIRIPKYLKNEQDLKTALQERKSEEKLPGMRAFWELMRIVFTEEPRTFVDAIRFAQGKLLTITGLRIGEIALLPVDWKRTQDYFDRHGVAAGMHGGVSRAMLLRHFAEKQGSSRKQVGTLWENTQFVPVMFEEIIRETLEQVERLTAPLRRTLKAQCETGRLLPIYSQDALVPVADIYVHMTGMPLTTEIPVSLSEPYIQRYRRNYDLTALDELIQVQRTLGAKTRMALYQFVNRLQKDGMIFRDRQGNPFNGRGGTSMYLRVDDVEAHIRAKTPTNVSDLVPFKLDSGKLLQPWELLFLLPKRGLGEARESIPCHVGRIQGVGVATQEVLGLSLSANRSTTPTLFETYGETDLDRSQSLLPHSLRHLQNTELFRLGVADTIITKRFNRRSVAQSYIYDHRSLQEELEHVTLADEWEIYLGPKATTVAKLIKAGRANGPIVGEFKRIQATAGDDEAYMFLKAEADGFHATPYGHCLNSFTVDPCPTHLECFNGCGHLSATDLPANRTNLIVLQGKLKDALEQALARDASSVGRQNQIRHAEVRLENIARLLETAAGERAFPDGPDLSEPTTAASVLRGT